MQQNHPSQPQQTIQLPPRPPRAVIQVVLTLEGQVVVQANCPPDRVLIQGLLAEAARQLLNKLEEAEQGPRVELAPPGLRVG